MVKRSINRNAGQVWGMTVGLDRKVIRTLMVVTGRCWTHCYRIILLGRKVPYF